MGILIGLKVSYEFPVVALHTISISACGACSEVVFEFQWRETCFGSFRAKPIFAPLGMPKWVWPSMNWYRMFFAQTSTLPLSMHRKLTERGGCCMQNNNCVQNSQPKVMLSWRITLLVQNLTPGEIIWFFYKSPWGRHFRHVKKASSSLLVEMHTYEQTSPCNVCCSSRTNVKSQGLCTTLLCPLNCFARPALCAWLLMPNMMGSSPPFRLQKRAHLMCSDNCYERSHERVSI